jgi:hypothetical protein
VIGQGTWISIAAIAIFRSRHYADGIEIGVTHTDTA